MTNPLEDEASPLFYAARAHTDEACAFWCARAIAQRLVGNYTGGMQEKVFNIKVKQLRKQLLALIKENAG